MNQQTKRSYGFTLLEILIVLAILLLGMSMLSQLMRSAIRESVFSEEQTEIQIICQNMMNRLMSGSDSFPIDKPIEIPGFTDWSITISLNENKIPSLMGIQILARKFEPIYSSSSDSEKIPVPGQRVYLEQWVGKDSIAIKDDSFGNRSLGSEKTGSIDEINGLDNGSDSVSGTSLFPPDPFVPLNPKNADLFLQSGFSSSPEKEDPHVSK